MKALLLAVALLVVGCTAPNPSPPPSTPAPTPPTTYYQGGTLIIDNRGAPAFNVVINGSVAVTVPCKDQPSLQSGVNAPPLPWDMTVVRVSDEKVLLTAHVESLPKWLVAFSTDVPMYFGGPILGPVGPTCPPGS